MHFQAPSGYEYPNQAPDADFDHKDAPPLLLEHPQTREFVTERNRERANHMRTPSPVKRTRNFF